jgi:hypothetical protein
MSILHLHKTIQNVLFPCLIKSVLSLMASLTFRLILCHPFSSIFIAGPKYYPLILLTDFVLAEHSPSFVSASMIRLLSGVPGL